ncbi:hypothetical protein HUN08_17980 [Gordonia sp. X0973]|uniref:MmpS family transport accessory protein n=1 Tax=Gordonia sp. X0973 TaxID=2742602 RepID=UPI000F531F96|nr:MmpS family transport accessory protein [Gordonia sp. X0973]QKT08887.1 hypothetical protein HUN08_17980 [Gordonia sp. X0973]
MSNPQGPQDPFQSSTRRFDPENPTTGYSPEQFPATEQYAPESSHYETGGYEAGDYQSGGAGGGHNRTKMLIAAIVAAIVAIILIAFLISVTGHKGGDTPAPASSSTTTSTTDESSSEESSTEPSTSEETTSQQQTGAVEYKLTGDGDLIGVNYTDNGRNRIIATVRAPWSVSSTADGGDLRLTGIVVRGTVTCQIIVDGQVVTSGTSSGGPLNCWASQQ